MNEHLSLDFRSDLNIKCHFYDKNNLHALMFENGYKYNTILFK